MNDLSHSGKSMLSGMNVKPSAVSAEQIAAFEEAGGTVQTLKPRNLKRHWNRTKSHRFGGKHSRFNMGGRNPSGSSRSASYTKHA